MLYRLGAVAFILCAPSLSTASTTAIGSASSRGEIRVDGYAVRDNATLFDGTVVETGQTTATLLLDKGTEIILSAGSRGTMYSDRLVLQKGSSELEASKPFLVEANSVRVTSNEQGSHSLVSLKGADKVEVAALAGGLRVTDTDGILVANVPRGRMMAFAMQEPDTSKDFMATGMITSENGHYFITTQSPTFKYELRGKNFSKDVGKTITVSGKIDVTLTPAGDAIAVVLFKNRAALAWIIVGSVAAGGAGLGVAIDDTLYQGIMTGIYVSR